MWKTMKRIHLAIVAVAIVAVLVIASATLITATDSFPKKAVLKAQDVESITNIQGNWTQESLNTYENSSLPYGAKHVAESGVRFENSTGMCTWGFTVAEMYSEEQADEQYHEAISPTSFHNDGFWLQTSLSSIGDEGVMFTGDSVMPTTGCFVFFHKGVYLVKMIVVWDATECQSIMLTLAEAQAERLP
jgi:hypothetical protein